MMAAKAADAVKTPEARRREQMAIPRSQISSGFEAADDTTGEYPLKAASRTETAEDEEAASADVPVSSSAATASDGRQNSKTTRMADSSIASHMVGDQPAGSEKEDRLGFGPYVAAVAGFLTDSSTKVPLTLSVEGLWGSGKSSFMLLLQEALGKLGRKKIVSFNAWQYNADEGLWAAFIHEFDAKMHQDLRFGERLRVRWRLFKLRLSWQDTVETMKTVIWLVASLFVLSALLGYLWQHGVDGFREVMQEGKKPEEAAKGIIGLVGGVGGTVAALMLFLTQFRELFKSPASLDKTAKLLARQKYDSQLPLIHKITHDFNELVTAYAGNDPVYIFIDDLDRCEYTRAADVMQALLMLLTKAPNVVLILGLDRDKVAAALAVKQESLLPYLYKVGKAEVYGVGMDYGQRFLEKFIQVTYILPRPSPQGMKAMINPEASPGVMRVPESEKSVRAIRIVTGKDDSETLERIVEMADVVFGHNPRNVKQFVNMFRLQAFIANETGLFGSSRVMRDSGKALSIAQLAKYVALCMRWPELVQTASRNWEIVGTMEVFFARQRAKEAQNQMQTIPEETLPWGSDRKLGELLAFGWPEEEFSLADVDFGALSEITPARAASGEAAEAGGIPDSAPPPQSVTPSWTTYAERQSSTAEGNETATKPVRQATVATAAKSRAPSRPAPAAKKMVKK